MDTLNLNPKDPLNKLLKKRYMCSLKNIDLVSVEAAKNYELYTTHSKQLTNSIYNSKTVVMLNVIEMLEYFNKGITVNFNYNDGVTIYNDVMDVVDAWSNIHKTTANVRIIPKKELEQLTNFANNVYELSKLRIPKHNLHSLFASQFNNTKALKHINMPNIVRQNNRLTVVAEKRETANVDTSNQSHKPLLPSVFRSNVRIPDGLK